MRRVVVTGLGVISAIGRDLASLRSSLQEGRSGTALITSCDVEWLYSRVAAEIRDFDADAYLTRSEQKHCDRQPQLALAAAQQAVDDAGFSAESDAERCGVILGTGQGPTNTIDAAVQDVAVHNRKPRPTTIPRSMFNAGAGLISIRFGCKGPSLTTVTACASSAHAIGQAVAFIRAGTADAFLVGGSEALPCPSLLAAWDTLRVMSTSNDRPHQASRPFSRDRDGFVMGEAGAMLVLESEERAKARGARLYGEVLGVGLSSDAHHLTAPALDGLCQAMRNALADAHLEPEAIDYINAHGTATPINDPTETAAIKDVFGDHAPRLPVSSTKSMHGHTIGAAGALEAIASLLAINDGFLPPTINLVDPDPACDLDYVADEARPAKPRYVMSNSFAFGGHNVALVIGRV